MKTNKQNLDSLRKDNSFKVPEGYFEGFTEGLMAQLPEKEKPEPVEISLWERLKPWVYMAAMFVGIMLMVNIFVGKQESVDIYSENVEDIPVSEIDEFYAYYEDRIAYNDYQQILYAEDAVEFTINY